MIKVDTAKLLGNYTITVLLLVGVFYTYAVAGYDLGDLINGAIISWVTLALNSHFTDQAQTRTARAQEIAYGHGATGNGHSTPVDLSG